MLGCIVNILRLTLPASLVRDLFRTSNGERWGLSADDFAATLDASVAHAFPSADTADSDAREIRTYAERLHLEDLALACACLRGRDAAWDHFVLTHRPILYRAADALDASGAARELADTLYGDLFGAKVSAEGRALFSYFHGRSTLATWLRAVLSQRYVDLVRSRARLQSLPDEDQRPSSRLRQGFVGQAVSVDPDRALLVPLVDRALRSAIEGLPPKDRLRLRSYHVAGLTLAQIGRVTAEHEATVSRHLTRTRRAVRQAAELWLRDRGSLDEAQIARALELAADDPGELDLQQLFDPPGDRKESS
ncbi:MAG TPA: sigma-70 family RNA polymerase sigma factor [Vicinamibacterales bacterium]|nr:sigma-70 family RNA polymerase sigma factor [Vicinamibacterales bacterium]